MLHLEHLVRAWDEAHRELAIAMGGLSDSDLWLRAHPRLLSVGELAGHIAFGEAALATKPSSGDVGRENIPIQSPLVDRAFSYYTAIVNAPVRLELTTADVLRELTTVHGEAKSIVENLNPESHMLANGSDKATWGMVLQYMGFHVAYHTGQIYSVREVFGHETEDN
ncbi:MAG: hypothetical protein HONBIEJF_02942 [Fimbriimonadaceae bacterium]|nr:hypothetical protein [Fimbriimonadaceae bacterium]